MNYKEVEQHQRRILQKIYDCSDVAEPQEATGVLKEITQYRPEEIADALGADFGDKLQSFAEQIDLSHPGLASLFGGVLTTGDFSKDTCDLLKLVKFAKTFNVSPNLLECLKAVVTKNPHYNELHRSIDSPFRNQLHVRFVNHRLGRDSIRLTKKSQIVGLGSLYQKGEPFWDQHPSDFETFHRNQNRYEQGIVDAQKRSQHFTNYGLFSMAGEIKRSIEDLNAKAKTEQYYGFNHVNLLSASIILGKLVGYEITSESNNPLNVMAFATPDIFPNFKFFADKFVNDGMFGFNKIEYHPRLYPLSDMNDLASDSMKQLIDFLESFPEMGGKPLFDYYRVLVPGLNYPNCFQRAPFHFKMPDGSSSPEFVSVEASQIALDRALIKEKAIVGILLGEKDGDQHFICYWM